MQEKQFRSFDKGMVPVFQNNISGTAKGALRRMLVMEDLLQIRDLDRNDKPLKILDVGCGEGFFSAYFAGKGHNVVLCDVSEEMIAGVKKSFAENNLSPQARFYCASMFDLPRLLIGEKFDLILCHALLEWIGDQQHCLKILSSFLTAGGYLSLLYYNRDALYFHSLLMGNFSYIDCDFHSRHKQKMTPDFPVSPNQVNQWLQNENLTICRETGIRVFRDYMRDKRHWTQLEEDILRYEQQVSRDPRFMHLGRYIHVLAKNSRQD